MSLKQAYEKTQPKSINDFFHVTASGKNRRNSAGNSNFFTKLNKELPTQA
ncbi:TPA: hypothetical protein R8F93_003275 [Enterobacter soli]|uniref:Uncharacterized protein n=1 Tax=Enterobacter soli TaxID=885040 RepID=A0AAW8H220_9ENTR|nr:hypothetical protein [Enterobacter soli]MDQ2255156.1 hypothetical protein [Enterobacter soli]MDQ2337075.1 hypothetical protein [Enterobacter soli]HEE9789214.1 hypothetical protein [Enterobacter soli]